MASHVLGISALFHDSAAVLLRDGVVVAAAQEERFSRVKHDAALPVQAARWCLAQGGISPADLDCLVFYEKPLRKFERILATATATFPRSWQSFPRAMHAWLGDKLWTHRALARLFSVRPDRILFSEHHLSHAASAFLCSPHATAAVLVADGVGEWATTSLWRGRADPPFLEPVAEVRFPHSLGLFYSAITAYLGFAVNEGEYKVMGMAGWGKPRFREQMAQLLRLEADGAFSVDLDYFCWHWHATESFTARLPAMLGPPRVPGSPFDPASDPESQRFADVAASAQAALEDAMLHLAGHAHRALGERALCLAGGVALNAVANHRLAAEGPFEHLWIQPASGDAGAALGAALWAWHAVLGNPRLPEIRAWCLGRRFAPAAVEAQLLELGARFERLDDPVARAAADLASGKVIGWFEGRGEWGPRALGNRSILADPRGAQTRDRVNLRVKLREQFRPFAPAVTEAAAAHWFDIPAPAEAPARAMLVAPPVRAERREEIAATTHVDGTARVQVVNPADSPTFHRLVEAFGGCTGTPVLLNTSFNLKGDPIASTPIDAMAAFYRSGLDLLYMEGCRVERPR
ncbi:MAG: carbamoyl transferase [Deltaproteobacteria bacterium]|nr:carbamoyl transferase [Deltaproteobacteria bacterium]